MDNLINTILKVDKTSDVNSIIRCINKSNILIFVNGIYLVADDNYIYYFGALEESRTPSKLGKFLKQFNYLSKGKLVYTKVPHLFNIKKFELINKEKGLYRWL